MIKILIFLQIKNINIKEEAVIKAALEEADDKDVEAGPNNDEEVKTPLHIIEQIELIGSLITTVSLNVSN